jgi:hypothetical protein
MYYLRTIYLRLIGHVYYSVKDFLRDAICRKILQIQSSHLSTSG